MSANAEQPGTSTCSCGNVIKIGTIYAESSRGAIECASCGSVAIRWGSPDAEREKRIENWIERATATRNGHPYYIDGGRRKQQQFVIVDSEIDEAVALMRSAPVEPKPDAKSVAEIMLDRWRERRKRCLTGVAPTVPEIEAAMSSWSTEVIVQKAAPEGSAMRRAVDAADRIIGLLWKHVESLRERFDYEMDQRDELHASYVQAIDERDDVLSRHKRLDAAVIDYRRKERELLNLPDSAVEEDHIAAIAALRGERDAARSALLKIASKVGVTYLADYTTEAAGPVSAIIGAIVALQTREHEARKQIDMLLADSESDPRVVAALALEAVKRDITLSYREKFSNPYLPTIYCDNNGNGWRINYDEMHTLLVNRIRQVKAGDWFWPTPKAEKAEKPAPVTDAAIEAAIRAYRSECISPEGADEESALGYLRALIARRVAEAGKVNADLLAAAKDLAVKAKAYVDQSWELERLRCDDAVAAFNAAVQRAEGGV